MSDVELPLFGLDTDYFEIFSLPADYQVDLTDLKTAYLKLQQQCHPDRFVTADTSAQNEAVRLTALLNQGYQALRSPLKRAIYMLERQGVEFSQDSQAHTDVSFLMQQMTLRERLDQAQEGQDPFAVLDELTAIATKDFLSYQNEFQACLASKDWDTSIMTIHKMMFASKLLDEIRLKEEMLDG